MVMLALMPARAVVAPGKRLAGHVGHERCDVLAAAAFEKCGQGWAV